MCKHVAAVLYGIGARLDHQPELLFRLREVDEKDLIAKAGSALPLAKQGPAAAKVLGGEDLSVIFGLDIAPSASPGTRLEGNKLAKQKRASKTRATNKATAAPEGNRKSRRQPISDPRQKPSGRRSAVRETKPRRQRKGMSKDARKAQSERMKEFWAAKRKAKA